MKMRPFELTLVVVFIVLGLLSLLLISTYKAKKDDSFQIGKVTIWGTVSKDAVTKTIDAIAEDNPGYRSVKYTEFTSENFDTELINALADGNGPDVILIPHEKLVALRNKIKPISYESVPKRDIQSSFVDGAQIYALSDGLYALPLMVDPLMLYWNKNILANKNLLTAPATWETLNNDYVPILIERNADRSIQKSVVALGEYKNITNAFAVISALLAQAGMRGVENREQNLYQIRINDSEEEGIRPLNIVADFYTRFSKPSNALYSWNRSFSNDKDRFLSEDLALYFGFASEAHDLANKNPNLSFDIAEIPQGDGATVRRTYGRFYGLALLKTAKNPAGANAVMSELTNKTNSISISSNSGMAPVRRDAIGVGSNDTYGRIAYRSAGIAFGWLNPKSAAVNEIFTTMTEDINENRRDLNGAVSDALGRLKLEYN